MGRLKSQYDHMGPLWHVDPFRPLEKRMDGNPRKPWRDFTHHDLNPVVLQEWRKWAENEVEKPEKTFPYPALWGAAKTILILLDALEEAAQEEK
jgi:hypothetical protein